MVDKLSTRLDAALAKLPPDLRELAEPNIALLRQSIEIAPSDLSCLIEDESADPQLRSTAVWIVGLIEESALAGVLARVIPITRQPTVLWEATKALCSLEKGGDLFLSILEDGPSSEHRTAAAWALGCLQDAHSIQPLVRILSSRTEPIELRAHVAEALAYRPGRGVFQALVDATSDPSAEIRFWSVFALGTLGDKRAIPLLERLAKNDAAVVEGWGSVSREAVSALEEIRQTDESPSS